MRGRPRWQTARGLTAGLVSVTAATAFLATAGAAQAVPQTRPVESAAVAPPGAVRTGAMPSSATLHFDVVMPPRNPAELTRYANEVSTPGSPLFHHYLAAGQFPKMFGPTAATISSVYAALRASGLNPGALSGDHLSIPVTATVGQVNSAFGARMTRYRLAGGRVSYANAGALRMPATVAGDIQGIVGLDNLYLPRPLLATPSRASAHSKAHSAIPAAPAVGPQPCTAEKNAQTSFDTNNSPFVSYNYSQLAMAYEFDGLYSSHDFGKGIKVGIVEFGEPNSLSDIATFQKCYGTHTSVSYDKVDGFKGTGPGEGEAALDIETVLSLAPNASIIVYQSPNSNTGVYDDYKAITTQDKARVVSISYGLCEFYQKTIPGSLKAFNTQFKKAAVQGQTIVASSGDSGSEACYDNDGNPNRLSVNFPASNPYVLGVGGTGITKLVARPGEVVWNDGYDNDGAGGGGHSTVYSQPSYQKSFGIKSTIREVPDVSADADPETGYMVFHTDPKTKVSAWSDIGGTSAAAPLWAALLTLTDARCPRDQVGWANSLIYYAASPKVKAIVINDIVAFPSQFPDNVNNNYTHFAPGNLYPVGPGYDAATGLGSPVGFVLAKTLCNIG